MPTLNQLIHFKKGRKKKIYLSNTPALNKNPQRKASCEKIFTCNPKKPNSAVRKLAKVLLRSGKIIDVYIPGEGHKLKRHNF